MGKERRGDRDFIEEGIKGSRQEKKREKKKAVEGQHTALLV